MKKIRVEEVPKIFLEAIFSQSGKLFSKLPYKIFVMVLLDIIGLENFPLSFSNS